MGNFAVWTFSLVVISLGLCYQRAVAESPQGCHSNLTAVNCRGKDLSEIPDNIPSVTYLDLSQNNIRRIETLDYASLTFVNLSTNMISHIHKDAFRLLQNLVTLDLSNNALSGVNFTVHTFSGLQSLETLHLQGNPILAIRERAFDVIALPKLKVLDLSFCGLVQISGFDSADIPTLESLSLRGNRLTETDLEVFDGFSFLLSLDMSDNPIKRIADRPFRPLIHLQRLSLENCQLRALGERALEGLDDLVYLSLRNNSLTDVSMKVFRPLHNLGDLTLSENPINRFDANFMHIGEDINWKIQTLRLDNMPVLDTICQGAFSSLQKLRVISLQNNSHLTTVEDKAFKIPFGSLTTIYLNNSGLNTLPSGALDWTSVRWVGLVGNPWYCDCKLRWMISVRGVVNKTGPVTCRGPMEHRGVDLFQLTPGDLGCVNRTTKIALGILLIACLAVLVGFCVYFILRWRTKGRYSLKDVFCFCVRCVRERDERYVSVYQNDDFEPFARITFSDEDENSKNAVDV